MSRKIIIERCCANCRHCRIFTTEIAGVGIFRCKYNKCIKVKDKVTGNIDLYELCTKTIDTGNCKFEPSLYALIKYNIYIKRIKEPIEARIEKLRKVIISKLAS